MVKTIFNKSEMCFNSDLELKPVGTLDVKLVQAKDLANKDMIGKSDPYAVVFIRPLRDKTQKTKTIVSNQLLPDSNIFILLIWIVCNFLAISF